MSSLPQSKYVKDRYRRYAVAVNENRALPRFTDGFKQSQRIALWVMKNEGIKSIKTIAMSGRMIASYLYVHGDVSATETVGRMASPYLNNLALLKGKGNFGSKINPGGMASGRYTDIARPDMLDDLVYADLALVKMIDNYDGSAQMPDTFLPILPLVLINGCNGSGVGFNTTIFPRDPKAIVKAVLSILETPEKKLKGLEPHFIKLANEPGVFVKYTHDNKPTWGFSGKVKIIDTSTVQITNLPTVPNVDLESFRAFLDELEEKKEIRGYIDNSSSDYDITVKFPRGEISDWSEEQVLNFFKLYKTSSENINVVDVTGTAIKTYQYEPEHKHPDPVERLIRDWVEWRFSLLKARFEHMLAEAEKELLFWRVLKQCFIDDVPGKLTGLKNRQALVELVQVVADHAGLTAAQVTANPDIMERIADRASYRWTEAAKTECDEKIVDCGSRIESHKKTIKSPDLQKAAFVEDVKAVMIKLK